MVPTLKYHVSDQFTVLTQYQLFSKAVHLIFTSIAPTSKRFRLESREEEYFAKGLRDSIIQDQQDSLRYAFED